MRIEGPSAAAMLRGTPNVRHLVLVARDDVQNFKEIASVMRWRDGLESVTFSFVPVGNPDIDEFPLLIAALARLPAIQCVRLRHVAFTSERSKALADVVRSCPKLEELGIESSKIHAADLKAVVSALSVHKSVTRLHLDETPVVAVAEEIARVTRLGVRLTDLSLAYCKPTPKSLAVLIPQLERAGVIRRLWLPCVNGFRSKFTLRGAGLEPLLGSLVKNTPTLNLLNVAHTNINLAQFLEAVRTAPPADTRRTAPLELYWGGIDFGDSVAMRQELMRNQFIRPYEWGAHTYGPGDDFVPLDASHEWPTIERQRAM